MAALPESPLFDFGNGFETVVNDSYYSNATRNILVDMRNLSDLFIANRMVLNSEHSIKQEDGGCVTRAILEYNDKARKIRARIFALPSADSPKVPVSKDFLRSLSHCGDHLCASYRRAGTLLEDGYGVPHRQAP